MDEAGGEQLIHAAHALFRELGSEGIATIAAVNGLAFGGGCELAMSCDVRIAARSALFGQPEIKLGIIPGFGGTQRLPRLVGSNKALEMNLVGDPILADEAFEMGLANRVVEDHELLDTALAWARKLASQAPLALEQIKRVSAAGDLDEGIEAEKRAFAARVRLRGRQGGHHGVPRQTRAALRGEVGRGYAGEAGSLVVAYAAGACASWARSRSGAISQRAASARELARSSPSGPARGRPRGRGSRPSGPCCPCCRRSRAARLPRPRSAGLGRQRGELRALVLDRTGAVVRTAPLSWISVGATQRTAGCARFHWQASCSMLSPCRSA